MIERVLEVWRLQFPECILCIFVTCDLSFLDDEGGEHPALTSGLIRLVEVDPITSHHILGQRAQETIAKVAEICQAAGVATA